MTAYDVVVLGGGPAGCATALALRRYGTFRTLVVESSDYSGSRVGESIPPDARLLLEQLGIFDDFQNEQHERCLGSCSSWGADDLGYNDFLFNPMGAGWHLDRARFDRFLARKANVRTATPFSGIERANDDGFELRLGTSEIVSAHFVVDATGRNAVFARQMGAKKVLLDRLTCACAYFALPPQSTFSRLTMLEAVEYGWWYAAKVPNGQLAVALACDAELMRGDALHERDAWLARLRDTRHLSKALAGSSYIDDSLWVCTAPTFLLDKTEGHRWLAVGDAASAYDPISSQGIYKALSNGLQAAPVIASLLHGRRPDADYGASIAGAFGDYLTSRNYFYGTERRWADAPFWKRRTERAALSAH